jgi:hypothetical protein
MGWYRVTKKINGRFYDYWQRTYRVGKSVKTENRYIVRRVRVPVRVRAIERPVADEAVGEPGVGFQRREDEERSNEQRRKNWRNAECCFPHCCSIAQPYKPVTTDRSSSTCRKMISISSSVMAPLASLDRALIRCAHRNPRCGFRPYGLRSLARSPLLLRAMSARS